VARIAVLRAQVIEDLRLEVLDATPTPTRRSNPSRTSLPLRELGPSPEEPRGFERGGGFLRATLAPV